jgi:hypothetical protein
MFGIFGDPKKKLQKKYNQLLEEAYRLSHVDRKQSDLKMAEADRVRRQLEALEAKES